MHVIDDLADGPSPATEHPVRVLIVEDDEVERLRLETLLRQARMAPICAPSVIEARVAMREARFDAAVIDVGLPDGDGLGLVPDLINGEPPCACVVLTGRDEHDVVRRAVELGVTQFLRKPASPHSVRQAIHMALQRTHTLRGWLDSGAAPPAPDAKAQDETP